MHPTSSDVNQRAAIGATTAAARANGAGPITQGAETRSFSVMLDPIEQVLHQHVENLRLASSKVYWRWVVSSMLITSVELRLVGRQSTRYAPLLNWTRAWLHESGRLKVDQL